MVRIAWQVVVPICDGLLTGFIPADTGPYASYPEYSRANSYPWSPSPPRRARPGPGPHTPRAQVVQERLRSRRPLNPKNKDKLRRVIQARCRTPSSLRSLQVLEGP